jgi:hypothetical protein
MRKGENEVRKQATWRKKGREKRSPFEKEVRKIRGRQKADDKRGERVREGQEVGARKKKLGRGSMYCRMTGHTNSEHEHEYDSRQNGRQAKNYKSTTSG